MKQKTHYYLMVSCPSDTDNERTLLQNCVDNINKEREDDSWVEILYWATDTASDAGKPAQDSINEQIVKDSDGLIAIFNARLGTPVHSYKCGTEEEIELMLKAGKHVSLLFNAKPRLDLRKDDCMDQLVELVKFKKEKSKCSYYKEFVDDEDFKRAASQEIRMWLRTLTASNRQETSESCPSLVAEEDTNKTKMESNTDSSEYDEDAGLVDVVEYINQEASKLTHDMYEFQSHTDQFTYDTNMFNDQLVFLQKQPSANSQIRLTCRQYAKKLNNYADYTLTFSQSFKSKWNLIYRYLKDTVTSTSVKNEDKRIIAGTLTALQYNFENFYNTVGKSTSKLENFPNFQKDLTAAIKHFIANCNELSSCLKLAVDNCEEIIIGVL